MVDRITSFAHASSHTTQAGGVSPDPTEQAFAAYTAAARRAQATLAIHDGREAGLAWSRFIKLFEGRAQ